MRTRKTRRKGGNRTSEFYPLRGFKYTNPTSSNLNLNLYSRQVGGTCEEKQSRECKKSCEKLCIYTKKLSKKDYEDKLKTAKVLLQAEIIPLETEFKRIENLAKEHHTKLGHPLIRSNIRGGFFTFSEVANPKCVENCHKSCTKNKKEICEDMNKLLHKSELNRDIEELQTKILNYKLNISILNHAGFK